MIFIKYLKIVFRQYFRDYPLILIIKYFSIVSNIEQNIDFYHFSLILSKNKYIRIGEFLSHEIIVRIKLKFLENR